MSTPYASVFDSLIDAGRLDAVSSSLLSELVERLACASDDNPVALLVRLAERAGHDREVRSWIGPGQPLPLTAEGVSAIAAGGELFDEAWIGQISQRHALEPAETKRRLAQLIPMLVKTLTPRGEIPSSRVVSLGLEALRKRAAR